MLPPPFLGPKVRRVDSLDAEMLSAHRFDSRAREQRVRCEIWREVECADEVGRVLDVGEEGDGDATASGWYGRVCSRRF